MCNSEGIILGTLRQPLTPLHISPSLRAQEDTSYEETEDSSYYKPCRQLRS